MRAGEGVISLIEQRLASMNTLALATVVRTRDRLRADIVLKGMTGGERVEIRNVPTAWPRLGGSTLFIAPGPGDVVLVGFTKHDRDLQLRDAEPAEINPLVRFSISNAVILGGPITEEDDCPDLAPGEILLQHRSGASIRITDEGDIVLTARDIHLNGGAIE